MNIFINHIQQIQPTNKYVTIYCALMQRAYERKVAGYTEKHHIVPRSVCPEWSAESLNIVTLTAREHFIAHLLLMTIYKHTKFYHKMQKAVTAFGRVNDKQERLFTSWEYKKLREAYSRAGAAVIDHLVTENERRVGMKAFTNGSTTIFLQAGDDIPDGYEPGMHSKGQRLITNGIITKRINNDVIPDGFWLGSSIRKDKVNPQKGKARGERANDAERNANIKAATQNRCWITDGNKNKQHTKDAPVPDGWKRGRSGTLSMKQTRMCDCCGRQITLANYKRHTAKCQSTD